MNTHPDAISTSLRAAARHAIWCAVLLPIGCASSAVRDATVCVERARRDALFDATRETLRDRGYTLDRVDSALGILTTHEKHSGGLPTRSSFAEDMLHQQSRSVRVDFEDSENSTNARITCAVRRVTTPSLRLSPVSAGLSSSNLDTRLRERGLAYRFSSPTRLDEVEAGAIAEEIRRSLSRTMIIPEP